MDSSLLDVSADIIGETPKKKAMSPKSFSKDVVERLAIVTPSGRVGAAESLSSNTGGHLITSFFFIHIGNYDLLKITLHCYFV